VERGFPITDAIHPSENRYMNRGAEMNNRGPLRDNRFYTYQGFHGCESVCRIRIYDLEHATVVLATECRETYDTSITNMAEYLATIVCAEDKILPERLRWITHYPRKPWERSDVSEFELVRFTVAPHVRPDAPRSWSALWEQVEEVCRPTYYLTCPTWAPISRAEVEALIGEALEELAADVGTAKE
jgi:hypothetical protein